MLVPGAVGGDGGDERGARLVESAGAWAALS
jgi:hypothetical protein